MNLLVSGLVNLRMLDLSDSDIGNEGLRFLTGKFRAETEILFMTVFLHIVVGPQSRWSW